PANVFADEPAGQAVVEQMASAALQAPEVTSGRRPEARTDPGEIVPGTLGHYRLLRKLGEGGVGTVYKAVHTKLDRIVALKVLPAERLRAPQAVIRFEREMRAIGKLQHPNIVAAHDAGEIDGIHYLVMELVEGFDLAALLRHHGTLPIAE